MSWKCTAFMTITTRVPAFLPMWDIVSAVAIAIRGERVEERGLTCCTTLCCRLRVLSVAFFVSNEGESWWYLVRVTGDYERNAEAGNQPRQSRDTHLSTYRNQPQMSSSTMTIRTVLQHSNSIRFLSGSEIGPLLVSQIVVGYLQVPSCPIFTF